MLASRTQWFPAVSVTLLTGAKTLAVRSRIRATRRSPALVATLGEADSVALAFAFFAPKAWVTPAGVLAAAARPVDGTQLAHSTPHIKSVELRTTPAQSLDRRPSGEGIRINVARSQLTLSPISARHCQGFASVTLDDHRGNTECSCLGAVVSALSLRPSAWKCEIPSIAPMAVGSPAPPSR